MTDWVNDIAKMHEQYEFHKALVRLSKDDFITFLKFRKDFLQEEIDELSKAIEENNPEEVVDALIDLCVVAIGTLDAFRVDSHKAWKEVLRANMNKEVGINPSRPNELGLPDLIKPSDWKAPSHEGNHGYLDLVLSENGS